MVSCSANGCNNRGEKGYCMKSFPRDPVIRKKWQENVNRIGWQPTDNSKLCEVHFLPEMWERPRVDGKKKLKWNAIPTVFPQSRTTNTRNKIHRDAIAYFAVMNETTQTEESCGCNVSTMEESSDALTSIVSSEIKDTLMNIHPNSFVSQSTDVLHPAQIILNIENPSFFHNYAQQPEPSPPQSKASTASRNHQSVQANYQSIIKLNSSPLSSSVFSESYVSDVNIPSTLNNVDLYKKIYQYQKSYTQLLAKVNNYKEQIKSLKQKNERLVKIAKKDRHLRLLKRVFNDDQICALEKSNCRFMKWTQCTLANALRLKNYCGIDGYEEILRQKIPLPSIRTLNRIRTSQPLNDMCTRKFSP